MKHFKFILPLAFLTVSYGCSCSNPEVFTQGADDDPIVVQPIDPLPINPQTPQTPEIGNTGSTLQLMVNGFESVDGGNHTYQSNKYRAHGNVRFLGGHRSSGRTYHSISSDLLKK